MAHAGGRRLIGLAGAAIVIAGIAPAAGGIPLAAGVAVLFPGQRSLLANA
jgi:hypothetical protein